MGTAVNLNGSIVPPEGAVVSVFDRGFLYGDSVYEVIRTYGGRPFALGRHLDRLVGSAARIGMEVAWSHSRFESEIERTLAAGANAESYVRLVATRGAGEIGLDPALATDPFTVVIVRALVMPGPEVYEKGVKLQVVSVRRNLKEAVDPRAKTGNYLNNVMALAEARRAGAFEAAMLDAAGGLTEGASSNVFVVQGGVLRTPPLEAGILEGVTRGVVLDVARAVGIPTEEHPLTQSDLLGADEVFITSTIREIVPVATIGVGTVEHQVGGGPGPVTRRLIAGFHERPLV